MKAFIRNFISALLLLSFSQVEAQLPEFSWAKDASGPSWDEPMAIAVDNSGNSFITGYFEGSITFGDTTYNSFGSADVFIAKYDPEGILLWSTQIGGPRGDFGEGICVKSTGSFLVTGTYRDSIFIGDSTITGLDLGNVFIAQFSESGQLEWFNQATGSEGFGWSSGIALDNNGNGYITGYIGGTMSFGDTNLTAVTGDDIYVASFDQMGQFQWALQASSGDFNQEAYDIATDGQDNVFITGSFRSTLSLGDTSLISAGWDDIFTVKYDSEGNLLWARRWGGEYSDFGYAIDADNNGNCAITGYFSGSVTFGDTSFTSLGAEDIITVKYGPDGNLAWARQAGGNLEYGLDEGWGIVGDDQGNFLVTGTFESFASFGDTSLSNSGNTDIFVVKYDENGSTEWAAKCGGSFEDWGYGIDLDDEENVFITGWFVSTAYFGETTLNGFSDEMTDAFIAKLSQPEINSIAGSTVSPQSVYLSQNYPNPFNPETKIEFSLMKTEKVSLKIYNVLGELVETLVEEELHTGAYRYIWNASRFATGLYFYKIRAGSFEKSMKMILIK